MLTVVIAVLVWCAVSLALGILVGKWIKAGDRRG